MFVVILSTSQREDGDLSHLFEFPTGGLGTNQVVPALPKMPYIGRNQICLVPRTICPTDRSRNIVVDYCNIADSGLSTDEIVNVQEGMYKVF